MNDVEAENQRNAEAAADSGALHGDFIFKIGMTQYAANFARFDGAEHVVFGDIGAGADVAGDLVKLPDFFFERHFGEQRFYTGVNVLDGSFLGKKGRRKKSRRR